MKARWAIFLLGLIVMVGVGLRVARLHADGPFVYPNGFKSIAHIKDEADKCYSPRSRVLFGAWSASEADDYRYWNKLSPVWLGTLYLWFRITGPGYAQARLYAVLWSAVSIILIYFLLAPRHRTAGLFAAALFAVNFYAVIFGRLGLLETPMNGFLLLSFFFLVGAREDPRRLIPASAFWLCAWFVKQSAAVYGPVLVAAAGWCFFSAALPARQRFLAVGVVAVSLILSLLPLFDFDYRFRTILNFRHVMDYEPDPTRMWMEVSPERTLAALKSNFTVNLWRGYFLMSPVAAILSAVELVMIGVGLIRKRAETMGVLAAIWWLSCRFFISIQGHSDVRFYLPQLPPTILLAGLALARIMSVKDASPAGEGAPNSWGRNFLPWALPIAALGLAAVIHLWPWVQWQRTCTVDVWRGGQELSRLIGERKAVLVGEWAGPLSFDTSYCYYYLKNVFNRNKEQIEKLGVTHLVVEADKEEGADMDPAVRRLRKFWPLAYDRRREVGRFTLWKGKDYERTIIVYELDLK